MTRSLTEALHLVRRFFGHLRARPLGPADQQYVHAHLRGRCAELFWAQSTGDQRHAVDVARRVASALPGDDEAIQAALLHDVGKIEARLGPVGRSLATILDAMHLPLSKRMADYRRHGALGAVLLESAGCAPLAVTFALHHPAPAPEGVARTRWDALVHADG